MKTTYRVLYVDGSERSNEVDIPEHPHEDVIDALVCPLLGSDDMQRRSVLYRGHTADMFVDPDAEADGAAVNGAATDIHLTAYRTFDPDGVLPTQPIYGTAVLFDRRVLR